MRAFGRFASVVVMAGVALAMGLALLAPEARALFTANASASGALIDLQPLSERSVVYAADGSVLAVLHGDENRSPVALKNVPDVLVKAIVDVEDERFWDHNGVDVRGTLRALYTNIEAGGIEQGGSTITQQLVKNALLTSKRDAGRKVKEAVLAVRLENQLSKREILERYLNTVYFGNGAYGVQAAAERYFGVDVGKITAGQAALLAGIIRNPVGYDPFTNPEVAKRRRSIALGRMVRSGDLTATDAERAEAVPIPSTPSNVVPTADGGTGYFVEEVKQRLLDDERLGETPQDRYNAVFKGGLQIHTTLDPRAEQAAIETVQTGLPNTHGQFTAALVSVDPTSGAVRALVGGPGFEQAKFNLATQGRRQAGSAFKAFTLMAALEAGHSPKDTISGSSPCRIPNPGGDPDPWRPENYEGTKGGTMSLTDATAHSVNCAYARLALIVGIDKVADAAKRMGITTPLDPTPAMTLGGLRNGVSPLEMASAYATLAADGVHHDPYFIDKVLDRDGKTILAAKPSGERRVSVQDSRVATSILQQVVLKGTGVKARVPGRVVAGKTGTAQDHTDAWFVGFTPQLSTAVWMGAPVGEVPMRNVGGIRVTGGSYPARMWSLYMTAALAGEPVLQFPPPNEKLIPKGTYLRLKGERDTRTRTGTTTRRRTRTTSTGSDNSDSTTVTTRAPRTETTKPGRKK